MPQSKNHGEITLRGFPGTRFSIWGSDCIYEYEKKNAIHVLNWLDNWIDTYVKPQLMREYQEWAKTANAPSQPAIENPPSTQAAPLDPRIQVPTAVPQNQPAGETATEEKKEK